MNNLKDFQSQHLFLLVGTNPLPNIVAAKLLRKPKGQVYFIHTDETLKIAQRLSDSLGLTETTRKFIFKEYPAACCGDGQETVLRKAAYSACND